MLLFLKVNPIEAYEALWEGAFGSTQCLCRNAGQSHATAPGGAWNLHLVPRGCDQHRRRRPDDHRRDPGNLGGSDLHQSAGWLVITLALLAGFLGGAIWGGIPGYLKAYFNVNEILSTVMMNAIAVQLMNFLLRGPMIDPSQAKLASKIPQTARLLEIFRLPRLAPDPPASGRVDRGGAGDPGLHPAVAHDAWISHPRGGAESACLALCRDQGPALCRAGACC